jgi:hypothetical protein
LTITSHSATEGNHSTPVAIRQFDIQPAQRLIYGFGEGWHEEEASTPATGLRWRWTSERSVLRLKGPAQPIRLTLRGESPLRYFDAPPRVKVRAGTEIVGEFRPASDFEWTGTVPADVFARSGGAVAVETDRVYLPAKVEGTSDERHLGLRLYEVRVETASH